MTALKIIYTRRASLSSALIRLGSWWAPWSHCGIVDGDDVIECLASKGGVVVTDIEEVYRRSSAVAEIAVECPRPDLALAWARSTVGAPYDWSGVIAIPFRERNWQDGDRWYCSEHVEQALVMGGRERFRRGLHGITPNQSFFVR